VIFGSNFRVVISTLSTPLAQVWCLVEAFECKFTDFHSHNMALISSLKELNQMRKYGKRKLMSMRPVTMKLAGPFYSSLKYSFLLYFIQTVVEILTDLLMTF